jgi:hypothetical protein
MKATIEGGDLAPLKNCWVSVPGGGRITLYALPDISDSKSAAYNDEPIIGRSFPMKTYSHSENRTISMTIHFYVVVPQDPKLYIKFMRAVQGACYPREGSGGSPYTPPPVCQIMCGKMLGDEPLCVVLRRYSVKLPTDVAWDEETYCPYKFDLETEWEVVYTSSDLPGAERIFSTGR